MPAFGNERKLLLRNPVLPIVRGKGSGDRVSEHLARGVAEHALRALPPGDDDPLDIEQDHRTIDGRLYQARSNPSSREESAAVGIG